MTPPMSSGKVPPSPSGHRRCPPIALSAVPRHAVRRVVCLTLLLAAFASGAAQAPDHETGRQSGPGTETGWFAEPRIQWIGASLLLAGSLALDERIRPIVLANRSSALDRIAGGADLLGTAGHIVPALVVTYAAARLARKESIARATLRIALSYAAADGVEAILKPVTGRVRPYAGREPLTFRPFTANDDFHSFPSAHVVHVASLGVALASEVDRSWVTTLSGVAMTFVGAQRVYRDQHWTSDVVASGMLAVAIASPVDGWLRRRMAASSTTTR